MRNQSASLLELLEAQKTSAQGALTQLQNLIANMESLEEAELARQSLQEQKLVLTRRLTGLKKEAGELEAMVADGVDPDEAGACEALLANH